MLFDWRFGDFRKLLHHHKVATNKAGAMLCSFVLDEPIVPRSDTFRNQTYDLVKVYDVQHP